MRLVETGKYIILFRVFYCSYRFTKLQQNIDNIDIGAAFDFLTNELLVIMIYFVAFHFSN